MSLQRLQRRRLAILCDPAEQDIYDAVDIGVRLAGFLTRVIEQGSDLHILSMRANKLG